MAKVTAKLNAAQALEKFPTIKGTLAGAKMFGDHVALLDMGRGAKAVVINGSLDCICPNATMAMVQVERALRIVGRHLDSTVRC